MLFRLSSIWFWPRHEHFLIPNSLLRQAKIGFRSRAEVKTQHSRHWSGHRRFEFIALSSGAFGSEATIDVFEASDRIGGRLDTIEIAGKRFEFGGSIIHPDNKYMGDFVKLLGKFVVKHLVIVSY